MKVVSIVGKENIQYKITIPKSIVEELDLNIGSVMKISTKKGKIILENVAED